MDLERKSYPQVGLALWFLKLAHRVKDRNGFKRDALEVLIRVLDDEDRVAGLRNVDPMSIAEYCLAFWLIEECMRAIHQPSPSQKKRIKYVMEKYDLRNNTSNRVSRIWNMPEDDRRRLVQLLIGPYVD